MTTSTMELLPGTEVHARGLRWDVVSSQSLGPQTLFRLRGLENAVLGHELDILFAFQAIEPIRHAPRSERAAPLVNWLVYHQAFLLEQALGPDALVAAQPGCLRIEPYQLVPVLRTIRMSRVRLLLADGVGLGKTVQAGLMLTELIARRLVHRILIVSPAGPLLDQCKVEMLERFGLRMEVIDRAKLEEVRRSTELGSNPFEHVPLGLVSVDFLKQERVLEQLDRASYDAVVIDEAHHCMNVTGFQDRKHSLRRWLAEVLARRCDCLALATATPHDGNDGSFASLCELPDPSGVDGRGLRAERYRPAPIPFGNRHRNNAWAM